MVAKTTTKGTSSIVTVDALQKETITEVACKFWAPFSKTHAAYSAPLVDTIYQHEMIATHFNPRKIIIQYLECYLWPNYTEEASTAHVMSIIIMLNEKFRERIDAWQCFVKKPEHFSSFTYRVLKLSLDETSRSNAEQCAIITFLVNSFNSVKLRKYWANLSQKLAAQDAEDSEESRRAQFERNYLWNLIARFKRTLDRVDDESKGFLGFPFNSSAFQSLITQFSNLEVDLEDIRYCERFIELLIDLEALLPTRFG
ncbi:hypothetical protein NECAME_06913 [Necator americanus]|uniref:RNA helicase aquarius N-terminal domain-containing protein n=1 Tax=Necator americanus TaxID=51031 RepID=W2TTC1_NECAM|nr:hypothetical protein NECAME_06913 [Necator americanus]ETN84351.1 hypothetical protein NECAME_06913 [Necator americanus]